MSQALRKTAEKHKKILEKIEYFSFQMELDGERYDHVLYLRFNKPSGILIADQSGQAVSPDRAKRIAALMNYYNNIAKGAANDLVREKDRDVAPMRDLLRILRDNAARFSDASIAEDERRVREMLELILDGQQSLKEIFEELKAIDIDARERRGYITVEDVDQFMALNERYQSILYRQGKAQQETYDSMRRLAEHVRKNAAAIRQSDRLLEVLAAFQDARTRRTLDESLKSFEVDSFGKRHSFSSGEAGAREMLALYKEKTRYETETNLFPLLRN